MTARKREVMMGQHDQPDQDASTNQAVELHTVLRRYLSPGGQALYSRRKVIVALTKQHQ